MLAAMFVAATESLEPRVDLALPALTVNPALLERKALPGPLEPTVFPALRASTARKEPMEQRAEAARQGRLAPKAQRALRELKALRADRETVNVYDPGSSTFFYRAEKGRTLALHLCSTREWLSGWNRSAAFAPVACREAPWLVCYSQSDARLSLRDRSRSELS